MNASLKIMDHTGDSKYTWNPNDPTEVEAAREYFNALKKKGFIAYHADAKGQRGEIVQDFRADLRGVIMVPPVVGG